MIDGDDEEKGRRRRRRPDGVRSAGTKKKRKRGTAERGIFISIRFFLVISHNATPPSLSLSLSLSLSFLTRRYPPHQPGSGNGHARAYHYREGIIG